MSVTNANEMEETNVVVISKLKNFKHYLPCHVTYITHNNVLKGNNMQIKKR